MTKLGGNMNFEKRDRLIFIGFVIFLGFLVKAWFTIEGTVMLIMSVVVAICLATLFIGVITKGQR